MIAVMNARTSSIKRKDLVNAAARSGLIAALALFVIGHLSANAAPIETTGSSGDNKQASKANSLKPPAHGQIPVAFVISDGAVIIDFCGPWEFSVTSTFRASRTARSVSTRSPTRLPLSTPVAECRSYPITLLPMPPAPKVVVIPAQSKPSEAMLKWIRESTKKH